MNVNHTWIALKKYQPLREVIQKAVLRESPYIEYYLRKDN